MLSKVTLRILSLALKQNHLGFITAFSLMKPLLLPLNPTFLEFDTILQYALYQAAKDSTVAKWPKNMANDNIKLDYYENRRKI